MPDYVVIAENVPGNCKLCHRSKGAHYILIQRNAYDYYRYCKSLKIIHMTALDFQIYSV